MLKDLSQLIRFEKPIGTLLLLWPCLIAIFAASTPDFPDSKVLLIFISGVFLMRSAGCIINDVADRNLDPFVKRTKDRPLAARRISVLSAIMLFILFSALSAGLALLLRPGTLALAVLAFCTAVLYPWMKRVTDYPQLILSVAFCWSIPMAYFEILGTIPQDAWILWLSMCLWVVSYDTTYAMVDKDDDLQIGIHSTAIAFGDYEANIIWLLQTTSFALFTAFGFLNNFNALFYIFVGAGYLYFMKLYKKISTKDRQQCFAAFLSNNTLGALLFFSVWLGAL